MPPDRYRVIITPRASAGLENLHRYIQKDSPQNAADVAAAIVGAIDGLESLPHRYPVHDGRRKPDGVVRRMPIPPFLVHNRVDDVRRVIHVVAILHGRRKQPKRFR